MSDQDFINRLAEVDIIGLARHLGLEVHTRGSSARALCPFHDDHDPSLAFYRNESGKSRYKCFACQEAGDIFDLVKKVRGCDFREAVAFLANYSGFSIPQQKRKGRGDVAPLDLALSAYQKMSNSEKDHLTTWAKERGFSLQTLAKFNVYFASEGKLSRIFQDSRSELDALTKAGLIVRGSRSTSGSQRELPFEIPPRDFLYRDRIIFAIRAANDDIVGFTGRAVDPRIKPKYLYTPSMPKSSVLYGLNLVRRRWFQKSVETNEGTTQSIDVRILHVVEGLTDAIRLASVKLDSVAVLGSDLSERQAELIVSAARELSRQSESLIVRLYFDKDTAGYHGCLKALVRLLSEQSTTGAFTIEILSSQPKSEVFQDTDPDIELKGLTTSQAKKYVNNSVCSVGNFLMAYGLSCGTQDIDEYWASASSSERLQSLRRVYALLPSKEWRSIVETNGSGLFATSHSEAPVDADENSWHSRLLQFLRRNKRVRSAERETEAGIEASNRSKLLRAIQIAHSSTQSRELPLDDKSWTRLLQAYHVSVPYLADLLKTGNSKIEPLLAIWIPKSSGGKRLKAIPCAEQLATQQYLLNELLSSYAEIAPVFESLIPAVRFDNGAIITTGIDSSEESVSVSFAYQIDMDVLNGVRSSTRQGIFRPYMDCWTSFIEYLNSAVTKAEQDFEDFRNYHVARLDVRSYYNTLSRVAVERILYRSLHDAMKAFDSPSDFAPLFRPELQGLDERSRYFVDEICKQTFDYTYYDPNDGSHKRFSGGPGRGIPQGPSLSAYLGTIALFPLDARLATEVNVAPDAVAYARYVDDMVLVARSKRQLDRLRDLVQQELGKIGLELSPKSESLPEMNAVQVQNWLVANRGGASVSGLAQTPPIVATEIADDGGIDRRIALVRLADPDLYHPAMTHETIQRVVIAVLDCPEIRFNDQCRAASLLWRNAAAALNSIDRTNVQQVIDETVSNFLVTWPVHSSVEQGLANSDQPDAMYRLAALRGLDKFLRSSRFLAPQLEEHEQRTVFLQRQELAGLVLDGLLESLASEYATTEETNAFVIALLEQNVLEIATCLAEIDRLNGLDDRLGTLANPIQSAAPSLRIRFSIAANTNRSHLIETLESVQFGSTAEHILLHEAIVRLSISTEERTIDPLLCMEPAIRNCFEQGSGTYLSSVLASWIPEPEVDLSWDQSVAIDSLRAFMNVSSGTLTVLLSGRSRLIKSALAQIVRSEVAWLPCLPVETFTGFIGYSKSDNLAIAVPHKLESSDENEDLEERPANLVPADLDWRPTKAQANVTYFEADVKQRTLYSRDPDVDFWFKPGIGKWLADSYENLVSFVSGQMECPPTATNLLCARQDEFPGVIEGVLGYTVSREELINQAYISNGKRGIIPKEVPAGGDHLWRAGIALADMLGLVDRVTFEPLTSIQRHFPAAFESAKKNEYRWAIEKFVIFSLHRLCGQTANSHQFGSFDHIPRSLNRVLDRLRAFPDYDPNSPADAQIAIVIATVFETRFAAARAGDAVTELDLERAGAATALLAHTARRVVYTDASLAEHLPCAVPQHSIKRRHVEAWFCFAQRIERLIHNVQVHAGDTVLRPLRAFTNGILLTALAEHLRSQTLELIASDGDMPGLLVGLDPSSVELAKWNMDGSEVFCTADGQTDLANVAVLLKSLNQGLRRDNRNYFRDLLRITPLGWAVALGVISGLLRSNLMLRFSRGSDSDEIPSNTLRQAVELLLENQNEEHQKGSDEGDPWHGLAALVNIDVSSRIRETIMQLSRLDHYFQLSTSDLQKSKLLRIEPVRAEEQSNSRVSIDSEVQLKDGTYVLEPWRIACASAANERSTDKTESIIGTHGDPREYLWTETRRNGRVLAIHVVQPGLAALAGFNLTQQLSGSSAQAEPALHSVETQPIGKETTNEETSERAKHPELEETTEPIEISMNVHQRREGLDESLRYLEDLQNVSWTKRSSQRTKEKNCLRIAFVQFQVEGYGSYRHPLFEICPTSFHDQEQSNPERHRATRTLDSPVEHRRRVLLAQVLRACKQFRVDCLLLPEYSTRPETVEWIKIHLRDHGIQTAVWAGTFRKPPSPHVKPADWLVGVPDWSAVLPVVIPSQDSTEKTVYIQTRRKKYPAIAYDEVFNPNGDVIRPIVSRELNEKASRVTELICSEIFLATSPSNLIGLWETFSALNQRFGPDSRNEENGVAYVLEDLKLFARNASLSNNSNERRSILFVPAMTPRSVDYSVLGQANYLASGITTVFCNDSSKTSHGQSCFIGHNGWDNEHGIPTNGIPESGPYHGVLPGIFRPYRQDRGWLGKNEQAMVIADVDPTYQSEGRPRPQNLLPPLTLVAHLPILEVGDCRRDSRDGEIKVGRNLPLPNMVDLLNHEWPSQQYWRSFLAKDFVLRRRIVDDILQHVANFLKSPTNPESTICDFNASQISGALDALSYATNENVEWLKKRAQSYRTDHAANPQSFPPPAILDWLYVNLNVPAEYPRIEVPPYVAEPQSLNNR